REDSPKTLLVIDQAEELFTLAGTSDRELFLKVVEPRLAGDASLWCIVIMPSGFLTSFLQTEQSRLFRDPSGVGALNREALLEVIERPAIRAGYSFEPPSLPLRIAAD